MNKHRLKLLDKGDFKTIHKNNLEYCLTHLSKAHDYLSEHLNGKNKFGLLTDISNAKFEIKKHLK